MRPTLPPTVIDRAFMPLYTNRLGDNVYPGAGRSDDGPALFDSRRSNLWLVKSTAWLQPAVRLGGTLAHIVELAGRCGGGAEEAAEERLLDETEQATVTAVAQLSASAHELLAHAFEAGGRWVRIRALPPPEVSDGDGDGDDDGDGDGHGESDTDEAETVRQRAAEEARAAGLLECLRPERLGGPSLPGLQAVLSSLLVRELRSLFVRYQLEPPPKPAETGASSHADALAQQLLTTLRKRRNLDPQPLCAALGPCVRLAPAPLERLRRLSLLCFSSAGYRPEEAAAVLRGRAGCLGRVPSAVPSAAVSPLYRCRRELLEAERATDLCDTCEAAVAASDGSATLVCLEQAMRALDVDGAGVPRAAGDGGGPPHPVAAAALARVVSAGCAQLRREKRHAECVGPLRAVARVRTVPHEARCAAWTQLAATLSTLGQPTEALRLCEAAHRAEGGRVSPSDLSSGSPRAIGPGDGGGAGGRDVVGGQGSEDVLVLSSAQLLTMGRLHTKLAVPPRRWKKPKLPTLEAAPEERIRCLRGAEGGWRGDDGAALSVEAAAIQNYVLNEGWGCGLHCENGIFASLFALLLWDALFAPGGDGDGAPSAPPDAHAAPLFGCPPGLADAPLDLRAAPGAFFARRRQLLEPLLARIGNDEAPAMLEAAHGAHCGKLCVGVEWGRHDLPTLQLAAHALGGRVVEAVCRHLAHDYASYCHGAPDLLLLDPAASPPRAKLVEVKGPGDRLRDMQLVWIDVLLRAGADVAVCYVAAAE